LISQNLEEEIIRESRSVDVIQPRRRKRKETIGLDHLEMEGRERRKKKRRQGFRHQSYLGTGLMYEWLHQLASRFEEMEIDTIAQTAGGRDIKIVKINSANHSLPIIFIDAGIHAREWISPAAILVFIEKTVNKLHRGRGLNDVANFQWHIIPVANPDGYEYTRSTDRLWRKNTVRNPGSHCIGVDLNRNFPEGYGVGASRDPCSEVYKGSRPFSEVESRTIRDYLGSLSNVKAAVSVHSYGNVLIYPWGYKEVAHSRRGPLSSLALNVSEAIMSRTGEMYEPGTAREVFGLWGLAGGATDDWYITQGVPYSYTFELPEKDESGDHGFLLPASNIIRVGKQLMVGFSTMAAKLR